MFDTRPLIDTCFKSTSCTKHSRIWKQLTAQLQLLSEHNTSIIISDEAFARMDIELQEEQQTIDNRRRLYTLFQTYYPGRVRIVIMYRHYYELIQSMFNEGNKPYKNYHDPYNPYKHQFKNWPSKGGKQCSTFVEYYTGLMKKMKKQNQNGTSIPVSVEGIPYKEYQKRARFQNMHVTDYLHRLWTNYSSEIVISNMHDLQQRRHDDDADEKDLITRFVRDVLPSWSSSSRNADAGDVLVRAKQDRQFTSRTNPSRNSDYDRLAVLAEERGLLVPLSKTTTKQKNTNHTITVAASNATGRPNSGLSTTTQSDTAGSVSQSSTSSSEEEILHDIVFYTQQLGLHLGQTKSGETVVTANVNDEYKNYIFVGDTVTSVAGISVVGKSMQNVASLVKEVERPVTIQFARPTDYYWQRQFGNRRHTIPKRFQIAELTETYLLVKLKTSKIEHLPHLCLNATYLQNLLQTSIDYEHQIFDPSRSKSSSSEEEEVERQRQHNHKLAFDKAVQRHQFCDLDINKLLENRTVQEFFTTDIPQLFECYYTHKSKCTMEHVQRLIFHNKH